MYAVIFCYCRVLCTTVLYLLSLITLPYPTTALTLLYTVHTYSLSTRAAIIFRVFFFQSRTYTFVYVYVYLPPIHRHVVKTVGTSWIWSPYGRYYHAAAAIDPVKTKNNWPKYYYTDINFNHLLYQCQNWNFYLHL